MRISSAFDGGNIQFVQMTEPYIAEVEIQKDRQSDFYQWFYFRLSEVQGKTSQVRISNAGGAAYPEGFVDYHAVASYDRETWFRVPTHFDGTSLTISLTPTENSVYLAYFAPYSMERHADLIAQAQCSDRATYSCLGQTHDGQDLDLLTIGEPGPNKKNCWVIARQHPGESMAEWWMEGFLNRILDEDDPVSRELLNRCTFYVVPNMNPDGTRRGHLRTNALGVNLNREWQDPSEDQCPEVFTVREKMRETGVDFFLDVHGDEALPYNFISGAYGIPSWTPDREAELENFLDAFCHASPDFQTAKGYERDQPGKANLMIGKNYVAETFKCLAMTLEMPFKDTADTPNEEFGWSPERSMLLGDAVLGAIWAWAKNS